MCWKGLFACFNFYGNVHFVVLSHGVMMLGVFVGGECDSKCNIPHKLYEGF